eukprot:m.128203 g.128203  ORF g.128203 m.128203 type:complete len:60 (-) comp22280_c0_seq1:116-295(-)
MECGEWMNVVLSQEASLFTNCAICAPPPAPVDGTWPPNQKQTAAPSASAEMRLQEMKRP